MFKRIVWSTIFLAVIGSGAAASWLINSKPYQGDSGHVSTSTRLLPFREWGFGGIIGCGPDFSVHCNNYGVMEVCTTYSRKPRH